MFVIYKYELAGMINLTFSLFKVKILIKTKLLWNRKIPKMKDLPEQHTVSIEPPQLL